MVKIFYTTFGSKASLWVGAAILIPLLFISLPLFGEDQIPPPPTEVPASLAPPVVSNGSLKAGGKDYFQPMVSGIRYQYEYLETKSQKVLADYNKQEHLHTYRAMEFLQSEITGVGGVRASFRHIEYSTSDSGPMTMVDNTLTYLVDDASIKNVTDMGGGKIYEDGFDLKMPPQDKPVTWVNVFHGDLSNIGGDPYEIEKTNEAYFGKCETPYGVYPDCVVVEEIDPGQEKDTLTRIYYAKSVGRVKDEYFNREKKKLRAGTAKTLYGKSWKSEMNSHNKNLMKWVDNGTSVLFKKEKVSGISQ